MTAYKVWFADSDCSGEELRQTTIYSPDLLTHAEAQELLLEQLKANAIEVEWLEVLRLKKAVSGVGLSGRIELIANRIWQNSPEIVLRILNLLPEPVLLELIHAATFVLDRKREPESDD